MHCKGSENTAFSKQTINIEGLLKLEEKISRMQHGKVKSKNLKTTNF
jgi:hypothetical protein